MTATPQEEAPLMLDRTAVRSIICQIPDGDRAAMLLKQIDALPILGGAQPTGDVKEWRDPVTGKTLKALSGEASAGQWLQGDIVEGQCVGQWQEFGSEKANCLAFMATDANFICALINAYRSGILTESGDSRLAESVKEHVAACGNADANYARYIAVRAMLVEAGEAIRSLDDDALGHVHSQDATWPVKHELLRNIEAALSTEARGK